MLPNPPANGRRQTDFRELGSKPSIPVEAAESEYVVPSLKDLFSFLRRRLWVICLVTALLTGVIIGYDLTRTPLYEASTMLLVGQERGIGDNNPPVDAGGLQKMTQTVSEIYDSRPVAEGVIQQLNLELTPDELLSNLDVTQLNGTQTIQVNYRDPSPERAQQIANATGDVFSEQIREVGPSASAITATVWERAVVPTSPESPHFLRDVLAALGLGLVLGTMLAYLLEYFDNSWRSPEELEQISGVSNLAVISEV